MFRNALRRFKSEHWPLYGMLAPYILGTLLLVVLPVLITVGMAFTAFDALSPPVWRGFWNFRQIFGDPFFPIAVRNSLYFVLLAVPLRLGAALGLAMLLNRPGRMVGVYRA